MQQLQHNWRGSQFHSSTLTSNKKSPVATHRCTTRRPTVAVVAAAASDAPQEGGCPFLAQVQGRTPPMVDLPWLRRVNFQLFHQDKFQAYVLDAQNRVGGEEAAGDTMVQVPKQPGFSDFYVPGSGALIKEVFAEEAAGSITQGLAQEGGYTAFADLFGMDNLLVVKDPERHAKLRALLAPAFSADAIKAYLPAIEALVARHLADWEAAGAEGVKAWPCLKTLTFDFILQVVMGHEVARPELESLSKQYADLTMGLVGWPYLDLPFSIWRRALRARDELRSYFEAGIREARQALSEGQELGGVLGRLVTAEDEQGNRLTDSEIVSNLLLVLLAGHDTSSTTLVRCLSNLQDHPAVMQKLRDEQHAVVAKHGPHITAQVLKDMPYAEAVLRESLRLDPVVGGIMRVSTRELTLGEYQVPASQPFLLPLRELAAHDPRWEGKTGELDPSKFNPDRLLTPEGQKPGQLMPFGAGARYCLGAALALAEMKTFLAILARSYSFAADNDTEWKPALGFYPANGLPLVLTRLTADG